MRFRVDPSGGIPVYEQIVGQVKMAAALGKLGPGEALPSVRQLAVELAVNPNTVARAYRDLEQVGVVCSRPGYGTFVAEANPGMSPRARLAAVQPSVNKAVVDAVLAGLSCGDLLQTIEEEYERITESQGRRVFTRMR